MADNNALYAVRFPDGSVSLYIDEDYAIERGVDPATLTRVEIPRDMFVSGTIQEIREYVALYLESHHSARLTRSVLAKRPSQARTLSPPNVIRFGFGRFTKKGRLFDYDHNHPITTPLTVETIRFGHRCHAHARADYASTDPAPVLRRNGRRNPVYRGRSTGSPLRRRDEAHQHAP